jgi:hypothetical protein
MKKILYLFLVTGFILGFSACSEEDLNTNPTDAVSGTVIFKSADAAYVALNGIYRAGFASGWSLSNTHQNFGIMSTNLVGDLMGEDMVQHEQGNGWFYYDYRYAVKERYTSTGWRSYATWNYYYTLISNANYILAAVTDQTSGSSADVNSILGQAYAIRAYSYFYLIQTFQRTYIGHETAPGVPIYTEPTTAETEGAPRGTVEDVYTLINADLAKAIDLLSPDKAVAQIHKSHIDYYVANGIKARVALVQNKWQEAEVAAKNALSRYSSVAGVAVASGDELLTGFNSVAMKGVIWGGEIIEDQATIYASFPSHMDASANMYANASRKCVGNWLYDQIPSTDTRKSWWNGPLATDAATGPNCSYNQVKFRFRTSGAYASDYIYMRNEEMLLIAAEALCRQSKYPEARSYLSKLGNARDTNYATRLAAVSDNNTQSFSSTGTISTLLDEILIQRRVELWCEVGRIFDILRLKQGFYRDWSGSNHSDKLVSFDPRDPESWKPILTIPQTEFDGNVNMDSSKDQNPM